MVVAHLAGHEPLKKSCMACPNAHYGHSHTSSIPEFSVDFAAELSHSFPQNQCPTKALANGVTEKLTVPNDLNQRKFPEKLMSLSAFELARPVEENCCQLLCCLDAFLLLCFRQTAEQLAEPRPLFVIFERPNGFPSSSDLHFGDGPESARQFEGCSSVSQAIQVRRIESLEMMLLPLLLHE